MFGTPWFGRPFLLKRLLPITVENIDRRPKPLAFLQSPKDLYTFHTFTMFHLTKFQCRIFEANFSNIKMNLRLSTD